MKLLLSSTLIAMFFLAPKPAWSLTPDSKEAVRHVDAKAAGELLKKQPEVVVLDIRTPEEFKDGHLAKAKNIDFYAKDFADQLRKLDRDKSYLVHCRSGGRSGRSLKTFQELGFKSVIHLDGGYRDWVKEGLPVEK